MTCPCEKKLQDYLNESLPKEEMSELEDHMDNCRHCQGLLDKLIGNPLEIDKEVLEVDDSVLIKRIKNHRKGIRRITVFGVLGFILGLLSSNYTKDSFIVTKALLALPYKLAEFTLGIFFSGNVPEYYHFPFFGAEMGRGYFPYHRTLNFLSTKITPALIASFLAITAGYLVSDKHVFRRKNILKFLFAAFTVLLLWIGTLHGLYSNTLNKIDRLEGISSMYIYEFQNLRPGLSARIDNYNRHDERNSQLINGISTLKKSPQSLLVNSRVNGFELWLEFTGGGRMIGYLDADTGILTTRNSSQYVFTPQMLDLIKDITRRQQP